MKYALFQLRVQPEGGGLRGLSQVKISIKISNVSPFCANNYRKNITSITSYQPSFIILLHFYEENIF